MFTWVTRNRVWGVAVSPDGRTIVSAGRDGTVKLWDCRPPEIRTGWTVKDRLKALAFAADGRTLITASAAGVISSWDPQTGSLRDSRRLSDAGSTADVILDRRGTIAALCRTDGFIEIHDLIRGRLLNTIGPFTNPLYLEFDPEGHRVVIAEGRKGVSLWDLQGASRSAFLEGDTGRALYAPRGRSSVAVARISVGT